MKFPLTRRGLLQSTAAPLLDERVQRITENFLRRCLRESRDR
jgi:hypothetical protein